MDRHRADEVDAVVIGSGAGGAPLALRLSQAGFRVLVLEKGPWYSQSDYTHDEVANALRPDLFVPSPEHDPHILARRRNGDLELTTTELGWIACCVGGGTAHMGGGFYRFHPKEFSLRTLYGRYEAIADWPYTYDDLEYYYSLAEWQVGVSGLDGANPTEGFRTRPYPMPPLAMHGLHGAFQRACQRLSIRGFPTPRAINSQPFDGRPACSYCDFCAGYGCPAGARGGTAESVLPHALRTGRCRIKAQSMVSEVTLDRRGRANGCVYIDKHGVVHRVRSSVVFVSCSAVESARLLLLSTSPSFPDGLGNGGGLVGRNLQFHIGSSGHGLFPRETNIDSGCGTIRSVLGLSVADHYFLPNGVAEFPKGGIHTFEIRRTHPIAEAHDVALSGSRPLWGMRLKRALQERFVDYIRVDVEVFQDFIPNDDTYVTLDPDAKDRWGLPAARIYLGEVEHHRTAGRYLINQGLEVITAAGADSVAADGVGYVNGAMAQGTCRAGSDPRSSVLDPFCQSHEVPGLFVVDGSFMPTSGSPPTTLTIMANSFRTADYVIDRARTYDLG